jgi:DNA-binding CsgD family transcriptional regulator
VAAQFREIRQPDRTDSQLTPHETRLLKLLIEGHNYKTGGGAEGERQHRRHTQRHVYEKLQVHSESEAVA